MRAVKTPLSGMLLIHPRVHHDARGFFQETFRAEAMVTLGIDAEWLQDNHSRSQRGVLRGVHYQVGPGQAKLVRCSRGAVWDVAVDLRPDSPTFGGWHGCRLDDDAHLVVYLPPGFGHAFVALSESADVVYKCSAYYDPTLERAIAWDDPDIGIEWPVSEPIVSERDRAAPRLKDAELPAAREDPAPA